MKGIFKALAWFVGVVVVLFIAAVILVPVFVDPNDYKGTIADAVKEQTGRDLSIEGDIRLSLFPRVSVNTGAVQLSNPDGFGDEPMLSLQEASVNVAVMPLLSKRVEADEIVLKRPIINLITLPDGRTNWEDLGSESTTPVTTPATDTDGSAGFGQDFVIKGVRIEDAEINWDDQSSETNAAVTALNVTTGPVAPNAPIDVSIDAKVEGSALPESLDVNGGASVTLNLEGPIVDVSALTLNVKGSTIDTSLNTDNINLDLAGGSALVGALKATANLGDTKASFSTEQINADLNSLIIDIGGIQANADAAGAIVDANVASATVNLTDNHLQVADVSANLAQGDLKAKVTIPGIDGLIDQQQFTINDITVDANINDWAPQFMIPSAAIDLTAGQAVLDNIAMTAGDLTANASIRVDDLTGTPTVSGSLSKPGGSLRPMLKAAADYEPTADTAFSNVALEMTFEASADNVNVSTLRGNLDDTPIDGSADIGLASGAYTLNLQLGALNVDDYLPKPGAADGSGAETTAAAQSEAATDDGGAGEPPAQLNLTADINLEQLSMPSAGITLDDFRIRSAPTTGSDGIPVNLDARVSGDALPESLVIAAVTTIDNSGEQPVLRELKLNADGDTLKAALDIPAVTLPGDDGTITLNTVNAEVDYDENKTSVTLGDLVFNTTSMALNIENITGNARQADLSGDFSIPGIDADLNGQRFDISGLNLNLNAPEPLGTLDIETLTVDLGAQTLSAPSITLDGDAGSLNASVSVTNLLATPAASGKVTAENLNVRQLLDAANVDLGLADESALTRLNLDTAFESTADTITVSSLTAMLDDTSIDGTLSARQSPSPSYTFNLNIGELNLDRYLAASDETPAAGDSGASSGDADAAAAPADDPFSALKGLTMDGSVNIAKLVSTGIVMENIEFGANAADDVLTLDPIKGQLFNGTAEGTVKIDVTGDQPKINAQNALRGIDIGQALSASEVSDKLEGTGNLVANVQADGIDEAALERGLTGTIEFNLTDGAIKGFDLQKILLQAQRAYDIKRNRAGEATTSPDEKTRFSEMSGSLVLANGIAKNNDLSIKAPVFRISGEGQASLVEETIDYLLTVNIVNSLEGQSGAELDELKNVPIPVTITGGFAAPKFGVDLAALVKEKAKEEAEEKIKEKLQEKLKGKIAIPGLTDSDDSAQPATEAQSAETEQADKSREEEQVEKDPKEALKEELKGKLLKKLFN